MYLKHIHAHQVRNLSGVDIEPNPQLNAFIGPNASGKTALLEAIHLLSLGKSFRTSRMKEVIQQQKSSLLVTAELATGNGVCVKTGIEKAIGKTTIHYNGDTVHRVSEQAKNVPLLLVLPDSHQLVTGTPKQRRHWLDWAMFHVKPAYLELWRDYHKSLRHRNALLKVRPSVDQLRGWEVGMAEAATKLSNYRHEFVTQIQSSMTLLSEEERETPRINYLKGWKEDKGLMECLIEERQLDREQGFTRSGIHRADLEFLLADGRPMAAIYSRGQIKKYVAALALAQLRVLVRETGHKPVFLIDDFAAEIDARTREKLIMELLGAEAQVFLTSTELDPSLREIAGLSLFHVEHGKFNKVIE